MRIIITLLCTFINSGCVIDYSVGDLRSLTHDELVREMVSSNVLVEFQLKIHRTKDSNQPLYARDVKGGGAYHRMFNLIATEHLLDTRAFGHLNKRPAYFNTDEHLRFGLVALSDSNAEIRLRLTSVITMKPFSRFANWVGLLSFTTIPIWNTMHRDLIAEAWDKEGKKILNKRYNERHRSIIWLPLIITYPISRLSPSYHRTIKRLIDHALYDLKKKVNDKKNSSLP